MLKGRDSVSFATGLIVGGAIAFAVTAACFRLGHSPGKDGAPKHRPQPVRDVNVAELPTDAIAYDLKTQLVPSDLDGEDVPRGFSGVVSRLRELERGWEPSTSFETTSALMHVERVHRLESESRWICIGQTTYIYGLSSDFPNHDWRSTVIVRFAAGKWWLEDWRDTQRVCACP